MNTVEQRRIAHELVEAANAVTRRLDSGIPGAREDVLRLETAMDAIIAAYTPGYNAESDPEDPEEYDSEGKPTAAALGPAYIHPQGVAPDGIWFDRSKVESLLARGIIDHCDDCEERYPDDQTYMIVGEMDSDEEIANLRIVERYEVPAP